MTSLDNARGMAASGARSKIRRHWRISLLPFEFRIIRRLQQLRPSTQSVYLPAVINVDAEASSIGYPIESMAISGDCTIFGFRLYPISAAAFCSALLPAICSDRSMVIPVCGSVVRRSPLSRLTALISTRALSLPEVGRSVTSETEIAGPSYAELPRTAILQAPSAKCFDVRRR